LSGVHLHELLEGSDVHLPEPVVPARVNGVVYLVTFSMKVMPLFLFVIVSIHERDTRKVLDVF